MISTAVDTLAHVPAARVTDAIATDLAAQQSTLKALHIDRAYLGSKLAQQRAEDMTIFCKAWPVRQRPYLSKSALLDWERHVLQCSGGERMPFAPGKVGKFPTATCARCALRERYTTSPSGHRVPMHPDAALLQELRERQQTPQRRAQLRAWGGGTCPGARWALTRPPRLLPGGASMCLINGAMRSCRIYMCRCTYHRQQSRRHEYSTNVLGLLR
jgi:hypothetical protein